MAHKKQIAKTWLIGLVAVVIVQVIAYGTWYINNVVIDILYLAAWITVMPYIFGYGVVEIRRDRQ